MVISGAKATDPPAAVGTIVPSSTTRSPLTSGGFVRQKDGSYLVEGATPLRELNRKLGLRLPLDGPRTVNGLILEHLREIPEPNTSLKIGECRFEIRATPRSARALR